MLLCASVGLYNILDANDFWVCRIPVQCKAVACLEDSHVAGDATKAEDREAAVGVVWFDNRAN